MPTTHEYVGPDIVVEHNAVTVFNAYKDSEYDEPMSYWFAVGACGMAAGSDVGVDGIEFDIRDLPGGLGERALQTPESGFEQIFKDAIDAGIITNDGILNVNGSDQPRESV